MELLVTFEFLSFPPCVGSGPVVAQVRLLSVHFKKVSKFGSERGPFLLECWVVVQRSHTQRCCCCCLEIG